MDQEMTVEFLESWHARRAGWEPFVASNGDTVWHRGEAMEGTYVQSVDADGRLVHPIAPTIDAAVLAFPKGWSPWERSAEHYWIKQQKHHGNAEASVPITGHTPEAIRRDLLALARLAWIAEGATP